MKHQMKDVSYDWDEEADMNTLPNYKIHFLSHELLLFKVLHSNRDHVPAPENQR